MKGKLWEMALDELLVKNVLLGRGCCKGAGEPSFLMCRVAFSGGLALGGTWPSLKEAHLHWCAYCYWFLFMVFKQLMQVLTAFSFSYLHKSFYFGKIPEDQWSGTPWERSRVRPGLGVASTKALRGWGPGKGAKNICHWDTRNSCGPGQINHSLGRSGYRGGRTARGDLPGQLCTHNSHYVHKWCLALCSLGLLFSMQKVRSPVLCPHHGGLVIMAKQGLVINVLTVIYLDPWCSGRQLGMFHAALLEMAFFQGGQKWFSSFCEYRTCQTCNKIGSKIKFSMTQNKITVLWELQRIPWGGKRMVDTIWRLAFQSTWPQGQRRNSGLLWTFSLRDSLCMFL